MAYDNFDETRRASEALRRSRAAAKARKERKKKLLIRRTIIVVVCALILFVAIFIVVQLVKLVFGIGKSNDKKDDDRKIYSISSETEAPAEDSSEATAANTNDPLTFVTPNIKDDQNSTGHYSAANGGVYIYNNMALELFGGSDSSAEYYAQTISEFKKNAPEYKVYNMVVPNHTEFALPRRLIEDGTVATNVQADSIKKIYESYTEDVQPINCYNNLAQHIDEYIYFNTDHHWSGLGAYYAYQAFCQQTGQEALDLSTCTEKTIPDFEGTLASYDESVMSNLDTVHFWTFPYATHAERMSEMGAELEQTSVYYEEEPSGTLSYGVFIWGDSPLFIEYNDELQNGKKIAVIKESYGNSFVPYLTNNYQEVHVIDPRHWTGNLKSYMQDNDIDEVLFINNVMSANTAAFVDDYIRSIY